MPRQKGSVGKRSGASQISNYHQSVSSSSSKDRQVVNLRHKTKILIDPPQVHGMGDLGFKGSRSSHRAESGFHSERNQFKERHFTIGNSNVQGTSHSKSTNKYHVHHESKRSVPRMDYHSPEPRQKEQVRIADEHSRKNDLNSQFSKSGFSSRLS